jgi:hypothetical protein
MRGKAILIAAVALFLGGAGAAAWFAINDDSHPSAGLLANKPAPTQATPAPDTPPDTTATEQPPPDAQSQGTTETAPPPAAPSAAPKQKTHFKRERGKSNNDQPQKHFGVPPAREFSGNGNAQLGTVNVKATSVLKWSAKGHLEIRFGPEAFPIVAPTSSGQLVLPPYRFERVRVVAAGRWKITISPQ